MPKRHPKVEERLDALREACDNRPGDAALPELRQALADRHYRIVAKAADLIAERLLYTLDNDLEQAYPRFLQDPTRADPNCIAKGAIVRALVALDSQNAGFFLDGIRYRQLEPVYGGRQDSAVDLRTTCAMGLAATAYPRTAAALAELLADPEPRARLGAARAFACLPAGQAEPVLRHKALSGDEEPEVVGECLTALLQVEPDHAVEFVARFLDAPAPAVRDLAALALGASRAEGSIEALLDAWAAPLVLPERRRVLLRAVALHRSDAALAWLLSVVEEADERTATMAVEEAAIYRHNERLRSELERVVAERGTSLLSRVFGEVWGSS